MKSFVILFSILGLLGAIQCGILFFKELPKRTYFHLPMLGALLLYSFGGVFVSYVFGDDYSLNMVLNRYSVGHSDVVYAMLLSAFFAFLLHFWMTKIKKKVSVPTEKIINILQSVSLKTLPFFLISIFLISCYAYLIFSGRIGYQGIHNDISEGEDASKLDPVTSLMQPVIFVLPLLCGFRIFSAGRFWTTLPVLLTAIACVMIQGRRLLQICIFMCILGVFLNSKVRASSFKRIGIMSALGVVSVMSFIIFTALRIASYSVQRNDILALTSRAIDGLTSNQQGQDVIAAAGKNVQFRGLNPIIYLAGLAASDRSMLGSGGEVLQQSIIALVPSVLWPNKSDYFVGEEQIAATAFQFPGAVKDEGNTTLTSGYTDFRELGLLLNLFFWICFMAICSFFIKNARTGIFTLILFSNTLWSVLSFEASSGSRMTFLRDMLLVFIIDYIVATFILNFIMKKKNSTYFLNSPSGRVASRARDVRG